MRTASVAIPRRTRNAANGPSVAPVSIWVERTAEIRCSRPDDHAGHHVAVPGQVLGGRLDHEVGAVIQRPAHERRRERVVHREQRAVPVGGVGEGRDVGEDAGRVGDGLDVEDGGRGGRQRGLDGGDVGGVDVRRSRSRGGRTPRRPACASCRSPRCRRAVGRRRGAATGAPRGSPPCRSRARSRPRPRGARRRRRPARSRSGCRCGCRRSPAARRSGPRPARRRRPRRTSPSGRSARDVGVWRTAGMRDAARIARVEGPMGGRSSVTQAMLHRGSGTTLEAQTATPRHPPLPAERQAFHPSLPSAR